MGKGRFRRRRGKGTRSTTLVVASVAACVALAVGVTGLAQARSGHVNRSAPSAGAAAVVTSGMTVADLDHGVTPTDLANTLVGGGLSISNVTYTGANRAGGTFTGAGTNIGFGSGVVLDSGAVQTYPTDPDCSRGVEGPNNCFEPNDDNSTEFGTPGDPDLDAIVAPSSTNDASVLEFDFVPQASTVQFNYVFSSEEYSDFANSEFNDVFGFFVNGNNCALIPGTTEPVSINTINNGNDAGGDTTPHHPELFRDNVNPSGPTIDTQMDGLTTVLTCTATVTPGTTNHMKLAIADTSDEALDSAVFLQAGSLTSGNADLSITKDDSPDPVHIGQELSYTLTATNNGPDTAHGVAVDDPLPAGVGVVSATTDTGTCSGTSTVDCTIGDLAAGASAHVTVVVKPTAVGTLSNTATVKGSTHDANSANDSATSTTTVLPAVKCQGPTATIVGTAGDDVLTGTPGDDVIAGQKGDDTIKGLGGNDIICGKTGNDTILGGAGNDQLKGGKGKDTESGSGGKDLLRGSAGADKLRGQGGKDTVRGGKGNDKMSGGGGNDKLRGHGGSDDIKGNGGNDKLGGGAGHDQLNGGGGKNVCSPGPNGAKLVKCERGKV